ncbi:hypothetical protein, partial [Shimazuella kribbensis]|uniref:hypothetical protein n=1 Tax=Shimazuella kribbensis TaxID=139808 RepID=UPI00056AAE26
MTSKKDEIKNTKRRKKKVHSALFPSPNKEEKKEPEPTTKQHSTANSTENSALHSTQDSTENSILHSIQDSV